MCHLSKSVAFCLACVLFVGACSAPASQNTPTQTQPTAAIVSPVSTEPPQYNDPFAYCAAVGTIDAPDARYKGPQMPESVVQGMIRQGIVSTDAPLEFQKSAVWRCMNGQVWVCHFGANIPCQERADTSQTPTAEMEDFCKANPTADSIPAVATGRTTVYEWKCDEGKPGVTRQVFQVDSQGYQASFWTALTGTGMANPASQNCIAQGGALTIERRGDGGEYGLCTFEDNRQCEEWALQRGNCPTGGIKVTGYDTPAARYCAITGGEYQAAATGAAKQEGGTCTFKNGQSCAAAAYFAGSCDPNAPQTYKPIALESCQTLQGAIAGALSTRITMIDAPFTDPLTAETGMACTLEAAGNGADFDTVPAPMAKLRKALTGWEEQLAYAAGGPTGEAAGFTRNSSLLLASVNWSPSPDANCPTDQPITTCALKPEQRLYTVRVQIAQK